MLKINEFDNKIFGSYDMALHMSKDMAEEIMKHFGYDVLPDLLPTRESILNEDVYLFLIDSKRKFINPVWNTSYLYGHQYNCWSPVGDEIENFTFDYHDYIFVYFNKFDIKKIDESSCRGEWPDRRPIFRDKYNID